ncbi:MAG: Hsp70 family protein, partial [Candidatus Pacebacteria bacterium]|nr:Hsp70 family protein [Candidatus Paceibacterota bacterium]
HAETLVYASEKAVREAGDKVSQEIKDAVNKKIEALKALKTSNDAEAIKTAASELSSEIQKIGQAMYGNQGGQQQQQQQPNDNQQK